MTTEREHALMRELAQMKLAAIAAGRREYAACDRLLAMQAATVQTELEALGEKWTPEPPTAPPPKPTAKKR